MGRGQLLSIGSVNEKIVDRVDRKVSGKLKSTNYLQVGLAQRRGFSSLAIKLS